MFNFNRPAIIVPAILVLIAIINNRIQNSVDNMPEATVTVPAKINKKTAPTANPNWKETDPKELEKYGITITPPAEEPTSSLEWETHLEQDFEKFKVLEGPAAKEALKEMATSRKDFDTKVAKLAADENVVKKRIAEDPFNPTYQMQLQNIYKLQALAKILEKKGLVNDSYVSQVLSAPPDSSDTSQPIGATLEDQNPPK